MVGMAQSCSGGSALGNYVMNEKKGFEISRNGLCGETGTEVMKEMKIIQDLNQRATNKTFSMVLSPEVEDGKKLSKKELNEIAKDFLTKLKIDPEKEQYVAFCHTEKKHKHIHIIANRVQDNGKLIPDNHIGKRAQWIAHDIAIERGLISAKEKMFEKMRNIELQKTLHQVIKNEIFAHHQAIIKNGIKSMEDYQKQMLMRGVKITTTINKQGLVQGHRMEHIKSGLDFKASDIHRQLGLKNLMEKGIPFQNKNIQFSKSLIVANLNTNNSLKVEKKAVKLNHRGMNY